MNKNRSVFNGHLPLCPNQNKMKIYHSYLVVVVNVSFIKDIIKIYYIRNEP